MALKPGRQVVQGDSDISFFMDAVQERGGIVVFDGSGGVGTSFDDPDALVAVPTVATGNQPAGLLANDVVDVDLTRYKLNEHKDEVQKGSKVALYRKGQVTTNMLAAGATPAAGVPAHYASGGLLTHTTTSARVGTFLSRVDEDGYVKVEISL